MSTYASPLSSGKTSPKGFLRVFGKVFSGSGVLESTALTVSAQGSPDMTVKVSGSALDDNAVFIHTDGTFIQAWNESDANVTITANTSGVTKTDAIVAYVDLTDYDATNANNPGSLKFIAVRRSGSDTGAPTTAEITSSAVSTNPYIVLAHVTVANGAGSINSGNIVDKRAFAAVDGKYLKSESVDTDQIADGAVTPDKTEDIWWEELARGSYSSGSSWTVSFTPKNHLMVIVSALSSGQVGLSYNFNSDNGNNYAFRYESNGGTDVTSSSTNYMLIGPAGSVDYYAISHIMNIANREKLVSTRSDNSGTSGASNAPNKILAVGKWVNTSTQISSITFSEGGTGTFATGTHAIILGHD